MPTSVHDAVGWGGGGESGHLHLCVQGVQPVGPVDPSNNASGVCGPFYCDSWGMLPLATLKLDSPAIGHKGDNTTISLFLKKVPNSFC